MSLIANELDADGRRWPGHWKYVLMLILIFLGMIVGAVVGVGLKRRHKRKNASRSPAPVVWGPHQHQHFTQGHSTYPEKPPPASVEPPTSREAKGKQKARPPR